MAKYDHKIKESKGLGDTVEKITHALGIDKFVEKVTKAMDIEDCGCEKRKEKLNEIFPYKNNKRNETNLII